MPGRRLRIKRTHVSVSSSSISVMFSLASPWLVQTCNPMSYTPASRDSYTKLSSSSRFVSISRDDRHTLLSQSQNSQAATKLSTFRSESLLSLLYKTNSMYIHMQCVCLVSTYHWLEYYIILHHTIRIEGINRIRPKPDFWFRSYDHFGRNPFSPLISLAIFYIPLSIPFSFDQTSTWTFTGINFYDIFFSWYC